MYITLNNIEGEKTIDLSHWIKQVDNNFRYIGVVSLFNEKVKYEYNFPGPIIRPLGLEKIIPKGKQTKKFLLEFLEGKVPIEKFDTYKENSIEGIDKVVITLNELDNTRNLEVDAKLNGGGLMKVVAKPSQTLLTYNVAYTNSFASYQPQFPLYKKLKTNQEGINSLNINVKHIKDGVVKTSFRSNIVFHVK